MQTLPPLLAILACPVVMGLMMLFMSKGMLASKDGGPQAPHPRSLAELKAEQARLHEQIERLQDRNPRDRGRPPIPEIAAANAVLADVDDRW